MKLYKYISLSKSENITHFYQMLFNRTMWCLSVAAFNDPQEFRFDFYYKESSVTKDLLIEAMKLYRKSPDLTREQKVEYGLKNKVLTHYLWQQNRFMFATGYKAKHSV